jgi:hypothetical protein
LRSKFTNLDNINLNQIEPYEKIIRGGGGWLRLAADAGGGFELGHGFAQGAGAGQGGSENGSAGFHRLGLVRLVQEV